MLPLPDLDDKTFDNLLEYAKKMIPRFAPGWTDFNLHDPGITLIELFAWLTEMQLYYVNKIREESYIKFFKLIDFTPKPSTFSKTDVNFSFKNDSFQDFIVLPSGTKLLASTDQNTKSFETVQAILVRPLKIVRVVSFAHNGYMVNNTRANDQSDMNYYAFENNAQKGCSLWLGFDQPLNKYLKDNNKVPDWMEITFNIYEAYPVKKTNISEDDQGDFKAPVKLLWEYHGENGWTPLQIIRDYTLSLTQSGRLVFIIPSDMKKTQYRSDDEYYYWIRGVIAEGKYELSPKFNSIVLNTTASIQKDTILDTHLISSDGIQRSEVYYNYLAVNGSNIIQKQMYNDNSIWMDVIDNLSSICKLEKDKKAQNITVTFNPDLKENVCIRLISYLPIYKKQLYPGSSKGLPEQTFATGFSNIIPDSLKLQVGEGSKDNYLWHDWRQVDNFDSSGCSDKHYVLEPESGTIIFGNGINGAIPPVSYDDKGNIKENIRIISCSLGGGSGGNVAKGCINTLADKSMSTHLNVYNPSAASGGSSKENISEAKARVSEDMKKITRAVTSSDYEALAYSTPGLYVAKAKALPLYAPGIENYPQNKSPASVSVTVVPYSETAKPIPGDAFLDMVHSYLDRFRLITTKLYVLPPEFTEISVTVKVRLKTDYASEKETVSEKIRQALDNFLNPISGGTDNNGWEFGEAVFKWQIRRLIETIPGIKLLEELNLNAQGKGTMYDDDKNILIPANGLVWPGNHNISVTF